MSEIIQVSDIRDEQARLENVISDLIAEARSQGASAAEAGVNLSAGYSVTARLGEVETIEHDRDGGLGVSVYFGHSKGSASTSDLSPEAIRDTVTAACNIARFTSKDKCAGLADADLMATEMPDLDLYHPWRLDIDEAIGQAIECEAAARDFDSRVINSEGASISTHRGVTLYGNSHGFLGGYAGTRHSVSCSVIAQQGDSMERDYWYSANRVPEKLESMTDIGRKAAERSVNRLQPRKLSTRQAPVIFQADIATSLLRSFIGAIRGAAIYRESSFLLDAMGKPVFPDWAHIHENPRLPREAGSAAFDNEGVATRAQDFIRDGVLQRWVLDSYAARKLGLQTTGNAGGVRNLRIDASTGHELAGLLEMMDSGLLITELMGQGVNPVTGDYSRGAAGYWVEHGEIQYPVCEITVAGNLRDMFMNLGAVGCDIDRRGGTQTGSWLVDGMMIAGE